MRISRVIENDLGHSLTFISSDSTDLKIRAGAPFNKELVIEILGINQNLINLKAFVAPSENKVSLVVVVKDSSESEKWPQKVLIQERDDVSTWLPVIYVSEDQALNDPQYAGLFELEPVPQRLKRIQHTVGARGFQTSRNDHISISQSESGLLLQINFGAPSQVKPAHLDGLLDIHESWEKYPGDDSNLVHYTLLVADDQAKIAIAKQYLLGNLMSGVMLSVLTLAEAEELFLQNPDKAPFKFEPASDGIKYQIKKHDFSDGKMLILRDGNEAGYDDVSLRWDSTSSSFEFAGEHEFPSGSRSRPEEVSFNGFAGPADLLAAKLIGTKMYFVVADHVDISALPQKSPKNMYQFEWIKQKDAESEEGFQKYKNVFKYLPAVKLVSNNWFQDDYPIQDDMRWSSFQSSVKEIRVRKQHERGRLFFQVELKNGDNTETIITNQDLKKFIAWGVDAAAGRVVFVVEDGAPLKDYIIALANIDTFMGGALKVEIIHESDAIARYEELKNILDYDGAAVSKTEPAIRVVPHSWLQGSSFKKITLAQYDEPQIGKQSVVLNKSAGNSFSGEIMLPAKSSKPIVSYELGEKPEDFVAFGFQMEGKKFVLVVKDGVDIQALKKKAPSTGVVVYLTEQEASDRYQEFKDALNYDAPILFNPQEKIESLKPSDWINVSTVPGRTEMIQIDNTTNSDEPRFILKEDGNRFEFHQGIVTIKSIIETRSVHITTANGHDNIPALSALVDIKPDSASKTTTLIFNKKYETQVAKAFANELGSAPAGDDWGYQVEFVTPATSEAASESAISEDIRTGKKFGVTISNPDLVIAHKAISSPIYNMWIKSDKTIEIKMGIGGSGQPTSFQLPENTVALDWAYSDPMNALLIAVITQEEVNHGIQLVKFKGRQFSLAGDKWLSNQSIAAHTPFGGAKKRIDFAGNNHWKLKMSNGGTVLLEPRQNGFKLLAASATDQSTDLVPLQALFPGQAAPTLFNPKSFLNSLPAPWTSDGNTIKYFNLTNQGMSAFVETNNPTSGLWGIHTKNGLVVYGSAGDTTSVTIETGQGKRRLDYKALMDVKLDAVKNEFVFVFDDLVKDEITGLLKGEMHKESNGSRWGYRFEFVETTNDQRPTTDGETEIVADAETETLKASREEIGKQIDVLKAEAERFNSPEEQARRAEAEKRALLAELSGKIAQTQSEIQMLQSQLVETDILGTQQVPGSSTIDSKFGGLYDPQWIDDNHVLVGGLDGDLVLVKVIRNEKKEIIDIEEKDFVTDFVSEKRIVKAIRKIDSEHVVVLTEDEIAILKIIRVNNVITELRKTHQTESWKKASLSEALYVLDANHLLVGGRENGSLYILKVKNSMMGMGPKKLEIVRDSYLQLGDDQSRFGDIEGILPAGPNRLLVMGYYQMALIEIVPATATSAPKIQKVLGSDMDYQAHTYIDSGWVDSNTLVVSVLTGSMGQGRILAFEATKNEAGAVLSLSPSFSKSVAQYFGAVHDLSNGYFLAGDSKTMLNQLSTDASGKTKIQALSDSPSVPFDSTLNYFLKLDENLILGASANPKGQLKLIKVLKAKELSPDAKAKITQLEANLLALQEQADQLKKELEEKISLAEVTSPQLRLKIWDGSKTKISGSDVLVWNVTREEKGIKINAHRPAIFPDETPEDYPWSLQLKNPAEVIQIGYVVDVGSKTRRIVVALQNGVLKNGLPEKFGSTDYSIEYLNEAEIVTDYEKWKNIFEFEPVAALPKLKPRSLDQILAPLPVGKFPGVLTQKGVSWENGLIEQSSGKQIASLVKDSANAGTYEFLFDKAPDSDATAFDTRLKGVLDMAVTGHRVVNVADQYAVKLIVSDPAQAGFEPLPPGGKFYQIEKVTPEQAATRHEELAQYGFQFEAIAEPARDLSWLNKLVGTFNNRSSIRMSLDALPNQAKKVSPEQMTNIQKALNSKIKIDSPDQITGFSEDGRNDFYVFHINNREDETNNGFVLGYEDNGASHWVYLDGIEGNFFDINPTNATAILNVAALSKWINANVNQRSELRIVQTAPPVSDVVPGVAVARGEKRDGIAVEEKVVAVQATEGVFSLAAMKRAAKSVVALLRENYPQFFADEKRGVDSASLLNDERLLQDRITIARVYNQLPSVDSSEVEFLADYLARNPEVQLIVSASVDRGEGMAFVNKLIQQSRDLRIKLDVQDSKFNVVWKPEAEILNQLKMPSAGRSLLFSDRADGDVRGLTETLAIQNDQTGEAEALAGLAAGLKELLSPRKHQGWVKASTLLEYVGLLAKVTKAFAQSA